MKLVEWLQNGMLAFCVTHGFLRYNNKKFSGGQNQNFSGNKYLIITSSQDTCFWFEVALFAELFLLRLLNL